MITLTDTSSTYLLQNFQMIKLIASSFILYRPYDFSKTHDINL